MSGKIPKFTMTQVIALEGELRPVADCPGYYIAAAGNLYGVSARQSDKLYRVNPFEQHDNLRCNILLNGRYTTRLLATIVATAYLDKPALAYRVCHRNGDWRDCRAENLYWYISPSRVRKGHWKLTSAQAADIRARYPDVTMRALAEEYGVHLSTISLIIHHKRHNKAVRS